MIVTVGIKITPFTLDSNLSKNIFSAYCVQRSMLDVGISKKYRDLSSRSLESTWSNSSVLRKNIMKEF